MFRSNVNVYAGTPVPGKLLSIGKRRQRLSQDHVMYDSRLKLNNHLTSSCLWQARGGSPAAAWGHWTERPLL